MTVCAYPGCNRTLYPGSITGLCGDHVHAEGLCKCKTCESRPKPFPTRDGVRTEMRSRYDTIFGEERGAMRVSLPKEPWGN